MGSGSPPGPRPPDPDPVRVADTVHLADHGQALVAHEIRLGIRQATPSL